MADLPKHGGPQPQGFSPQIAVVFSQSNPKLSGFNTQTSNQKTKVLFSNDKFPARTNPHHQQ
jgi:hypothetical protein